MRNTTPGTEAIYDLPGTQTLPGILKHFAARKGDEPFLLWSQRDGELENYSWNEMVHVASGAVAFLREHGITVGERFCVHLRNRPETIALLFAAAATGSVIIPTNTRLTARELSYVFAHAQARLVVTEPEHAAVVQEALAATGRDIRVVVLGEQPERSAALMQYGVTPLREDTDNGADVATLYTSGTTANPKGVRISQAAFINAGHAIAAGIGFTPQDRNFAALPLFHVISLCYPLMTALVTGGSIALADRFSASNYLKQVTTAGATVGWLAITPLRMLLAQPPRPLDTAHPLRRLVFGQNLTHAEYAAWAERFGVPLLQIYGMTETVTLPIMNPLYGPQQIAHMGMPALGVRCRVVVDAAREARAGETGELYLALQPGRQMMSGYLFEPEATAAAFDGEWFKTGDLVARDRDGFFRFVDRKRDVLKISGENVSAGEGEMVLNEHPAVFDSAVAGKADPLKVQVIKAFVVLHEGRTASEAELISWCRERLAGYKVPVEIEFRTEFPRTSAGKIQKNRL